MSVPACDKRATPLRHDKACGGSDGLVGRCVVVVVGDRRRTGKGEYDEDTSRMDSGEEEKEGGQRKKKKQIYREEGDGTGGYR